MVEIRRDNHLGEPGGPVTDGIKRLIRALADLMDAVSHAAPQREAGTAMREVPAEDHQTRYRSCVGSGTNTLTFGGPRRHRRGMHLDLSSLEAGLDAIRRSPMDDGRVELVVRRPAENERETLAEAHLDTAAGLVGDAWLSDEADPARQVTVMNARVVGLLARSRERWPLAGDQLYVDLDLSGGNLPPGTQLEVGSAVLEVTAEPHRGCKKFAARFGLDALRFVNSNVGYALNLRGINTRVVRAGVVRPGDVIRKLPHG